MAGKQLPPESNLGPINLLASRRTKITVGGQELFVWCDTHKGRLRLRVHLPDGAEVEHIQLQQLPDSV